MHKTIYSIYEKVSYPGRDLLIDSYDTEGEAKENLNIIIKYSGNNSFFYIRKEEEHYIFLENADSFCYGISD